MPLFDFKCEVCGKVEEHKVDYNTPPTEWPRHCKELMDKQWPKTNFAVKGFSAKNGYSKER